MPHPNHVTRPPNPWATFSFCFHAQFSQTESTPHFAFAPNPSTANSPAHFCFFLHLIPSPKTTKSYLQPSSHAHTHSHTITNTAMATMEEKIKTALAHKDQGNEAFKQGDMKQGNKPSPSWSWSCLFFGCSRENALLFRSGQDYTVLTQLFLRILPF